MTVPPKPTTPPQTGGKPSWSDTSDWNWDDTPSTAPQATTVNNKTRNGGGFNPSLNPSFKLSVTKNNGPQTANTPGQPTSAPSGRGGNVPGADFMGNEDIRAYSEYRRKNCRNQATELAMDADHLEAVLKTIPDQAGGLGGSRARARRVSRWLKKAAAAEKNKQKYFAALYGTFEREYDSELRTIGKGRLQQKRHAPFGWN